MDFIKKLLQTNQEKGRASVQLTVENDYNLPDYKADMLKLVDKKGSLRLDGWQLEADQITVEGALLFQVLYKCTEYGSVCSLQGEVPFTEQIHMNGAQDTDQVVIRGNVEDLTIGMINSRKLNVKALMNLYVSDMMEQQIELPTGMEDDTVEALYGEEKVLQLLAQKKDVCRIRSEIVLPSNRPNIHELLWQSVQLRGLDSRARDGEIEVTGELLVNILYRGEEDDRPIQCMETTVALHEKIACSVCEPEMLFKLVMQQMQLEVVPAADEDGEQRILMLEGSMEFYVRVWQEEKIRILEDAYSLQQELKLVHEPVMLQSLLVKNDSKFRVSDQLRLENLSDEILQLCACVGEVLIEGSRIMENAIEVEGILKIRMLYVTSSDDMPVGVAEGVVPFTQQIEAEGIREGDAYELTAGIDQLTVILTDNVQTDIKAVIGLDVIVFGTHPMELICGMEQQPTEMEQYERQLGIVGYIVKPGDRLWDIAKQYHTTMEDIMQMNQLSSNQVAQGDKLLIVKQVGRCVL